MKLDDALSIIEQMIEKWYESQPEDVFFDGRMMINVDITVNSKLKIGKVNKVTVTDLRTH